MNHLKEFIERCKTPEIRTIIHESAPVYSSTKWGRKNRERLKASQKKYEKSEKGMEAIIRRYQTRNIRERESKEGISCEEITQINNFYLNTPEGCEVDHIIPLAAGGKHSLYNLRYLTPEENRIKGSLHNGELTGKWRGKTSKYLN